MVSLIPEKVDSVPALQYDAEGGPQTVLFGLSCHPCTHAASELALAVCGHLDA